MYSKTRNIINRLPDFYTREEGTILSQFAAIFGQVLEDAELDLLLVMRSHWVNKASNEGSQGFNTTQKGDLDKIFTLYLENLGGTSQLKQVNRRPGKDGQADDALYRRRVKGLIQVLLNGASTKEGVKAIVAANLGIIEDETNTKEERDAIQAAREKIRIVEFAPGTAGTNYGLTLYQSFTVSNPNPTSATPQIRITLRPDLPLPLANLKIVNTTSNESVSYSGILGASDVLALFADGSALHNGVAVSLSGPVPGATPGDTTWQVEAMLQVAQEQRPVGRFGVSVFDDLPHHAWMFSQVAFDLNVSLTELTPGFFTVYIPWDIPGFTDKFDELSDHPRTQIGYIVNKVKAAGVGTAVVYEKNFAELHEAEDHLSGQGEHQAFADDEAMEEFNFDIGSVQEPYPGGIDEQLEDNFIASGVFDFTSFDSLNTFA